MPRVKSTHVDDPRAVGRRLREARERAGLSQRELAFAGCSPAYISRIESGDRIPSLQLIRELARRLSVSEEFLAQGREGVAPILTEAEVALRLAQLDDAEALFRRVLDDGETAADRSRALEGLGQLAVQRGEPDQAVELLNEALAATGEPAAARPALAETLARALASLGDLTAAIELLEQCVEQHRQDPLQYVRFSALLGFALTDNGNFAEAERVVSKALAQSRDLADPYARARLYWSEFRVRSEQGQSERAEAYARKALETLRILEDERAVGLVHQALAHICLDLERPGEALDLLREGSQLLAKAATPLELAQYRIEEARALAALGEHEQAGAIAMEASNRLGDTHPVDAGRTYALLAEVFAQTGDTARARELFELAIETLERRPPTRYLIKSYKHLAALLEQEGHRDEALALLKRALDVQVETSRPIS